MLDSARATGIPTEPLVDRALEGAAKGASDERILAAVRRLWAELGVARTAFGDSASAAELRAGASALRAGATRSDLETLRARRPNRPLIVAAGVLADLVAVGVPSDTAIAAVLALAEDAGDADYIASDATSRVISRSELRPPPRSRFGCGWPPSLPGLSREPRLPLPPVPRLPGGSESRNEICRIAWRGGAGTWQARVHASPGGYRLNIRVDGGPWLVPRGTRLEQTEFGGAVGVIVIP